MRPVEKGPWPTDPNNTGVYKVYSPYDTAKDDLFGTIDEYCSYCECWSMSSSIAVEHVQAKECKVNSVKIYAHLSEDWNNFIIACVHCNSIKGKKDVVLPGSYMPHITNTWLCFKYTQGGAIGINSTLSATEQNFAKQLMGLVGLDRRPGKRYYSSKDKRWDYRRKAWDLAERYINKYQKGEADQETICELAKSRGFWSVWISVFASHQTIKTALTQAFKGTFADFEATNLDRV